MKISNIKDFDNHIIDIYQKIKVNPKVHEIETRAMSDIQRAVEESGSHLTHQDLSNISFSLPNSRHRNATTDGNRLPNK